SDWTALRRDLASSQREKQARAVIALEQTQQRDLRLRGKFSPFTEIRQDLFYAFRTLRIRPGFALAVVLTLALGIGANVAIFSLIDALMLRSLPVQDPQRLMLFRWTAKESPRLNFLTSNDDCQYVQTKGQSSGCSFSRPFMNAILSQSSLLASVAGYADGGNYIISGKGSSRRAQGELVTGTYFETLGVHPAIGRLLEPADDAPGAAPALVLSYRYWQSVFAGDPAIVGNEIDVNGKPFTLVGIGDPRFTHLRPGNSPDFWLPVSLRQMFWTKPNPTSDAANSWWLVIVGRLKNGVTRSQAEATASTLLRNQSFVGEKRVFRSEDADPRITLVPAQSALTGIRTEYSKPLYILMAIVGVVLLAACANVAGLMTVRATARQQEMAVRLAVGASRSRLVRQLLTESLALSVIGAGLGLVLARWGEQVLVALLTNGAARTALTLDTSLDPRVLSFAVSATVVAAVLFGLLPALRATRIDLTPNLKGAGDLLSSKGATRKITTGDVLVVTQVALSLIVLAGAGLLVRTLQNLHRIDPGFAVQNVLTFGIDSSLAKVRGIPVDHLYADLQQQFAGLPGVASATYSGMLLLSGSMMATTFAESNGSKTVNVQTNIMPVGPNFFQTMGIPILQGRGLSEEDFARAAAIAPSWTSKDWPMPAVANETFVRQSFQTGYPVGAIVGVRHGDFPSAGYQIVGVAHDAKYNDLREDVEPTLYSPAANTGYFELRTDGNTSAVISSVRSIAEKMDLPIFDVKTQAMLIDEMLYQERLLAKLSSFFAVLIMLLACIGIYGLLAYEVSRRTREIGIRVALGATTLQVFRYVMLRGFALAATGAILGAVGAVAVTRYLDSLLYGVKPTDPLSLAAVAGMLLLVGVVACFVPAHRATRVDPLIALRHE
ncbi:MAG TPA: ABC transporter permease, partial [Candidatus Acidoferrales bacterium]|nr:ABC transporter permease [Candidatus Acidoferrales bacterium]